MPNRPDNLTDLQARFAEEYLIDLNATQAAIRAGCNNSSKGSAAVSGHEFLSNPNVAEYIHILQSERSKTTKIDAAWLLERLAAEATADISELYDEFGALRSVHEWPLMFRMGLVQGMDVQEEYQEVDDPDGGFDDEDEPKKIRKAVGRVVKVKLSDRAKRLEMIGKHIGVQAFREQVGLSSPTGGPIEIAVSARDRIADRLNRLTPSLPPADDASGSD